MGRCTLSGIGGTGAARGLDPPIPFVLVDLRNMDRTRVIVFCRLGVLGALVEGVEGCFRRKSVLMSAAMGCGSDMLPKEEPLWRRVDLRRCAPRRQTVAMVRSAPATSPGKNPTRTAAMGNFSQDSAVSGAVPFVVVTGTTDADCVLVEEVVGDEAVGEREDDVGAGGVESCWLAFITHRLCVLQL